MPTLHFVKYHSQYWPVPFAVLGHIAERDFNELPQRNYCICLNRHSLLLVGRGQFFGKNIPSLIIKAKYWLARDRGESMVGYVKLVQLPMAGATLPTSQCQPLVLFTGADAHSH